jgi:hypothetical protein
VSISFTSCNVSPNPSRNSFAELALLLPYHDIRFIFFGGLIKSLLDIARKNPGSLAGQDTMYSYTAPIACGSSTFSAHLWRHDDGFWTPQILGEHTEPRAIIGLNAGLVNYPQWHPLLWAVYFGDIPFGVTEYMEKSVETQAKAIPQLLQIAPPSVPLAMPRSVYPRAEPVPEAGPARNRRYQNAERFEWLHIYNNPREKLRYWSP